MSYITNQLTGNVTLTGALLPSSNVTNLGSPTQTFGNLFVGSHSIVFSNPDPTVPPTLLGVSSSNLMVISRGGLSVRDNTNLFDTFQVDPTGQVVMRSNVVLDPFNPALNIIGNASGAYNAPTQPYASMIHVTGSDGTQSVILNDSYGTGTYSGFIGRKANGTAAVPTQLLSGDLISRFGANGWGLGSPSGFAPFSTARIEMYATENQTLTTRGSNVTIVTTPVGTPTPAVVATFDTAGIQLVSNVLVGTDLTVTGNSIAYGHSTTYGNVVSYGNLISTGTVNSSGGIISNGNTQINGDTQFSGNVTALRGIRFSNGSNITTAGVSYVNVGTGLATSAAVNNGINITTSAILGIAGTPQQISINQVGGNVTLSLPQSLATNSIVQFGNLTVGNLTVTGNITSSTATNLNVANKIIYAGNGATSYGAIDGGGFVLGNSEVAQSMLWFQNSPGWRFNSDLYPLGNVYIGGLDADGGDLHAVTAYVTGNLQIGQLANQQFANANLQVTGSAAATVQVTVQNLLSDPAASGDFVATADTGSDTVNYVDLGINSSTYNQIAYSAQRALDAYLYSSDSNLVISTANVTIPKQIVFTTGGIQTANVAGFIDGTGNWVLSPLGTDDGVNKLQVGGNARFSGNVTVGNLTATGSIVGGTIVGQVVQANQTLITQLGIQNSLQVSGDASVAGNVSVGKTVYANQSVSNVSAFAQALTVAGLTQTNQFVSNLSVTTGTITGIGTTRVNTLIANAAIQSIGQITSQSIVNNTGVQTDTLNVISAAQVNSLTTNLLTTTNTLNVVGTVITNSLVNNTGIQTNTLNVTGAAQVNSMTTNLLTTTNTLNVVGTVITNSLVNNTGIQTNTLNVTGAAQVNSMTTNLLTTTNTLNVGGLSIVNSLYSNTTIQAATSISSAVINGNTSVTSPGINATAALWGQSILSNSTITAATVITAQSMVSNSSIYGQSLNLAGTAQVGAIISNTTIQALGLATVNSLISNNSTTSGTLTVGGAAQLNSLVTNTNTTTATLNTTGAAQSNSLISNVYGVFGQNVTINSTNASTTTGTGALVVKGGIGVAGDSHIGGNLHVGTDLNYTPANALFQYGGSQNNFLQAVTQNANTGNVASTDIVAVANNGSDSVNYIDMGITGSGYAQPAYALTKGNDGYLIVAGNALATYGGNLVISTYTQRDIIFALNGGNVSNEVARFRSNTNTFVVTSGTVSSSYITGAVVVNGGMGIAGAVNTNGQIATTAGLNVGTTAIVNNLIANATVFGGNINTSGTATVQNLIVNAAASFGNLVIPGTVTANNFVSNLNIYTSTINTGGLATLASLVVNVNTTTNSLNVTGAAEVSSFISNNLSTTATLNVTGLALVNSLVSNNNVFGATLQSSGVTTVNSLVSNTNVFGSTAQTSGTALFNAVVSNTNVTTGTLNTTGTAVADVFASNVYGLFGQNVTVNSTNAATSTGTGALQVKGGIGATGNVWVGNLFVAAGTTATASINFTSGSLMTTPTSGGMEYDGKVIYATPSDSQRGVMPAEQWYELAQLRTLPLTNQSPAAAGAGANVFTLSANVSGNTRYAYEIWASVLRAQAGVGTGGLSFAMAGTATLTEHNYVAYTNTSASNVTIAATNSMYSNLTAGFNTFVSIIASPGAGSFNHAFNIKGVIGVSGSGTVTPQITITTGADPTVFQVAPGSWMRIYPIGNTTSGNLAVGNWT